MRRRGAAEPRVEDKSWEPIGGAVGVDLDKRCLLVEGLHRARSIFRGDEGDAGAAGGE
jgi:hypothetical protein